MRLKLEHVYYMPKDLEQGILYVSKEFETSAHLCACKCGSKVRTPLGPTEWTLRETKKGPTLTPSIGNWQLECQSHYWIFEGEVKWADKWSEEQIEDGRRREQERRIVFYKNLKNKNIGWLRKMWLWIKRK